MRRIWHAFLYLWTRSIWHAAYILVGIYSCIRVAISTILYWCKVHARRRRFSSMLAWCSYINHTIFLPYGRKRSSQRNGVVTWKSPPRREISHSTSTKLTNPLHPFPPREPPVRMLVGSYVWRIVCSCILVGIWMIGLVPALMVSDVRCGSPEDILEN